jgi:UDP-N-acetylmuramoylalanine--D-glutamate ligase
MKIAIAGYGAEGKANYEYYATRGEVTIVDEREKLEDMPPEANAILGKGAFEKLDGFDLVVRTAGLAPRKIKTDGKLWSATNEFFERCPAAIIGVTGTKGKGTTCSLIASILREAGETVRVVGNIGVPALAVLPEVKPTDIVVYELSSFQLWDIQKSPEIAVVLMIEPDHLDVHADFEEYVAAKANIRKFQTQNDVCFYHPTNPYARHIAEASSQPNAYRYGVADSPCSVYTENGNFMVDGSVICPVSALQLPGAFNVENACAAINAALEFNADYEAIERGLRAFSGLEHRLKFVREVAGVKYYNDSIATTPGSAMAAMKAFEQPKILILGGSGKGADFTELADVAAESTVKLALLMGSEADKIARHLEEKKVPVKNFGTDATMEAIVKAANERAEPGDVVVLSPACASFGMFKDYKDRGDQFVAAVEAL